MEAIGNQEYIFLTSGKIGTTSLVNVNGFGNLGSYSTTTIKDILLKTYSTAEPIIMLRNPVDRFYKGLFQLFISELPFSMQMIKSVLGKYQFGEAFKEHLVMSKFWDDMMYRYNDHSHISKGQLNSSESYHFGPWLYKIANDPDIGKCVHINNLTRFLSEIGLANDYTHSNKTDHKIFAIDESLWSEIYETFKSAVDRHSIHQYIEEYLTPDIIAYQELMDKEYYDSDR